MSVTHYPTLEPKPFDHRVHFTPSSLSVYHLVNSNDNKPTRTAADFFVQQPPSKRLKTEEETSNLTQKTSNSSNPLSLPSFTPQTAFFGTSSNSFAVQNVFNSTTAPSNIPSPQLSRNTITNSVTNHSKKKPPLITSSSIDSLFPHTSSIAQKVGINFSNIVVPQLPNRPTWSTSHETGRPMNVFPTERAGDFKRVVYNLLVDTYNNPDKEQHFVRLVQIKEGGIIRNGFAFNEDMKPDERLPEMYSMHVRKANLAEQDKTSVFTQDLYKYYLRAAMELLSKYFEKRPHFTFLYVDEDLPLFIPGESLESAEQRISQLGTKQRHQRKRDRNDRP
eukprot:TRINITY_DN19903_c0_g1_i1.p1 TRINITY_DN19903_c0_g1~~TRINITY_DN19903_c0_g1_i1.p1  ORF type:complete len:334 (-),score=62.01 TRINITY_DN19903_c0_g1_i1:111-1112(-)